jgi:hypothetical protein
MAAMEDEEENNMAPAKTKAGANFESRFDASSGRTSGRASGTNLATKRRTEIGTKRRSQTGRDGGGTKSHPMDEARSLGSRFAQCKKAVSFKTAVTAPTSTQLCSAAAPTSAAPAPAAPSAPQAEAAAPNTAQLI